MAFFLAVRPPEETEYRALGVPLEKVQLGICWTESYNIACKR